MSPNVCKTYRNDPIVGGCRVAIFFRGRASLGVILHIVTHVAKSSGVPAAVLHDLWMEVFRNFHLEGLAVSGGSILLGYYRQIPTKVFSLVGTELKLHSMEHATFPHSGKW